MEIVSGTKTLQTYTHRHTHRQTDTHTDRHTQTDRQTDTHTQTDTHRQTHTDKHTQTDTHRQTHTLSHFGRAVLSTGIFLCHDEITFIFNLKCQAALGFEFSIPHLKNYVKECVVKFLLEGWLL